LVQRRINLVQPLPRLPVDRVRSDTLLDSLEFPANGIPKGERLKRRIGSAARAFTHGLQRKILDRASLIGTARLTIHRRLVLARWWCMPLEAQVGHQVAVVLRVVRRVENQNP